MGGYGRSSYHVFFFCTIARSLTRVPFVKKSSHCGSPIHSFVLVETTNSFLDFSINLQSILALDVLLSRIQSFFYIRFIPIFTIPSKESNFQGLSEAYPQMALRYSEKWWCIGFRRILSPTFPLVLFFLVVYIVISHSFSILFPYPITGSSTGRDDGQSAIFGRGPSVTRQQGWGYVCVLYIYIYGWWDFYHPNNWLVGFLSSQLIHIFQRGRLKPPSR